MSNWYNENSENIAVSTRIRLARNLSGLPFPSRMTAEQFSELNEKVKEAIFESNTPFAKSMSFIYMDSVPEIEKYSMVERHIISPEFAANSKGRAIVISEDESVSIMIGEEDHLRIQVILGGMGLEKAYDIAERLDYLLCDRLNIAFDSELGFLTGCPTNLGTGLRASVMLHLPMLENSGEISSLADSVGKIGFTVRGMYGEGSKATASFYQVSNQITLGISEKNAIDNLKLIAMQLIEKENKARETLNKLKTEDMCFRSLGTLQNARLISGNEMMKLLSGIKLGADMGIIKVKESPIKLFIEGQPYMLMRKFGEMGPDERDIYRANMIREILN